MNCPNDQTALVATPHKGITVNRCPRCRGVWVDSGELDKIIDLSVDAEIAAEANGLRDG